MKTLMTASLLASTLLASAALAQSTSGSAGFITRLEPGQMLASKIMDEEVLGANNEDIGDVEDLVLDRDGRVVALVVEVEEGLGDRTVALPLSAVRMGAGDVAATGSVQNQGQAGGASAARNSDDVRIMVTMPVDQLKSAPEFDDND
ncbi:PRC-barrel domain-containing protein [Microvirga arsenatis]|uniref:PRC-barrel domain-containing protein n=1 Tax=Microvirga arsenatis TaxID=2692265 RepID=A0ABW9YXC5_9HYPH|nr:PRC-barrel domain-containing protein [Microvirga arsenatis]NBJ10746.1 hypothetical protein [Microvirga arsenatis]NBJ24356.1 hypothetical protein [Microvirga arsenatis]